MGRYVVRRLLYMVVVLLVVSFITFGLMHAVPGGPFDREKALPPEIMANLNARYHLDDPLMVQYGQYLYDVMLPKFTTTPPDNTNLSDDHLINIKIGNLWIRWMNFGPTFSSRSRTVNDIFRQQLPISMQLGLMALTVAVLIGIPLGIIAALKQNTIFDYLSMSVAIFGVSVPVIVLGPLLIWIFGVTLKWLPPTGWGSKPPYVLGFLPSKLGW
ncbi:MAG TPA: ABC transporter permease subunit, partial [Anaerolineaceae bacterium]|nr:ABC transporter permease subunit [Anaerolineaceae bacterium]